MHLALAVALTAVLAAPEDISPPPRGQWVVDQTGRLSSRTVQQLNEIAANIDATRAGQLGIAVIESTDGMKPRDFGTRVFNSWGVGHHTSNDGVLILVAVGDRKAEIILGDGTSINSSQTDVVMRDNLVANMKRANLDEAVLSSSKALAALIGAASNRPHSADNGGLGPNSYTTPENDQPQLDEALDAYVRGEKRFPELSPRSWVVDVSGTVNASTRARLDVAASDIYAADSGRIFFLLIKSTAGRPTIGEVVAKFVTQAEPLSGLAMTVIARDESTGEARIWLPLSRVHTEWERSQVRKAEQALAIGDFTAARDFAQLALTRGIPPRPMGDVLSQGVDEHSTALSLSGVGALGFGGLMFRRWRRNRPRICTACNVPMQRLNEEADDAHLTDSQRTEEQIKSVDYDVWQCGRCDGVQVLDYSAIFSSYSKCPGCAARTKSSTSTTEVFATEYSGGRVRVDEKCANCNFKNSYTRSTPRIVRSESSSSSSSSFGGGSSSGGGSSGSW
jgi:LPXTG-motif cell wall-anchored protein